MRLRLCAGVVVAIFAAVSIIPQRIAAGGTLVDRIAATVDDVAIAESDVWKAMVLSPLKPADGESSVAFRARVLDALIDQRLQYREALRFGPSTPEPREVDAALDRLKARLRSQRKDPAKEFASSGMTEEEVRSALERQIVVQNYLQERFRPIALPDEERAREEYDKVYVPQQKAAGNAPQAFEAVADDMRKNSQQRVYDEEADRWMKEIRLRARVAIFNDARPIGAGLTPVPLAVTPAAPPRSTVTTAAPASKR